MDKLSSFVNKNQKPLVLVVALFLVVSLLVVTNTIHIPFSVTESTNNPNLNCDDNGICGFYPGTTYRFVTSKAYATSSIVDAFKTSGINYGTYSAIVEYQIIVSSPTGTKEYNMGSFAMTVTPNNGLNQAIGMVSPSFYSNGPLMVESQPNSQPSFKILIPDSSSSIGPWTIQDYAIIKVSDIYGNVKTFDVTSFDTLNFNVITPPPASIQVCNPVLTYTCSFNQATGKQSRLVCDSGGTQQYYSDCPAQCKVTGEGTALCVEDNTQCSSGQIKCGDSSNTYKMCSVSSGVGLWGNFINTPTNQYCSNNQLSTIPGYCTDGTKVGACSTNQGQRCVLQNYQANLVGDSVCQPSPTPQPVTTCSDGTAAGQCNSAQRCNNVNGALILQTDFSCQGGNNNTCPIAMPLCQNGYTYNSNGCVNGCRITGCSDGTPFGQCSVTSTTAIGYWCTPDGLAVILKDSCKLPNLNSTNCTTDIIIQNGQNQCTNCSAVNLTYDSTNKKCIVKPQTQLTTEQMVAVIGIIIVLIIAVYYGTKKRK